MLKRLILVIALVPATFLVLVFASPLRETAEERLPETTTELVHELFRTADPKSRQDIELVDGDHPRLNPALPSTLLDLLDGPLTMNQATGTYEMEDGRHLISWSVRYPIKAYAETAASSLAKRCGERGFPQSAVTELIQEGGTADFRVHCERSRRYMMETIEAKITGWNAGPSASQRATVNLQWSLSCEANKDEPLLTPHELATISPRLGGIRLKNGDQILYDLIKEEPIFMSVLNLCPDRPPASWWEVRVRSELRGPFEEKVRRLGFQKYASFNRGAQVFWERRRDGIAAAVIGHPDGRTVRLRCVPRR